MWFLLGYWIACALICGVVVGRANKQWLQNASILTVFTVTLLVVAIRDGLRADRASVKTLAPAHGATDAPRSASVRE